MQASGPGAFVGFGAPGVFFWRCLRLRKMRSTESRSKIGAPLEEYFFTGRDNRFGLRVAFQSQ
jgi:hypothetical protein